MVIILTRQLLDYWPERFFCSLCCYNALIQGLVTNIKWLIKLKNEA